MLVLNLIQFDSICSPPLARPGPPPPPHMPPTCPPHAPHVPPTCPHVPPSAPTCPHVPPCAHWSGTSLEDLPYSLEDSPYSQPSLPVLTQDRVLMCSQLVVPPRTTQFSIDRTHVDRISQIPIHGFGQFWICWTRHSGIWNSGSGTWNSGTGIMEACMHTSLHAQESPNPCTTMSSYATPTL